MLKIGTLFSGIGAPEAALKRLGIDYNLAYFCDIDKYAVKSYCAIHGEPDSKNLGDITKIDIDKLPKDLDLVVGGSPCQDFSTAGKGAGGDIYSQTRSSLMWNYIEVIRVTQPKTILWENVPGVLTDKHRHNYNKFYSCLNEIGYNVYAKVLNAKDFGVPQNRKRIFVLGIRKDQPQNYQMPIGWDCGITFDCLLDKSNVAVNFVNSKNQHLKQTISKINTTKLPLWLECFDRKINTINASTITAGIAQRNEVFIYFNKNYIRKPSALECLRLMGFSDEDYAKVKSLGMSDSQIYKQAGNSIVVNVLMAIFGQLYGLDWQPKIYGKYYKSETERMVELPLFAY